MLTETSEVLPGYRIDPDSGAWLTIPWPADGDAKAALARSSLGPDLINWAEGRTDEPGLTDYLTGDPWEFTAGQKRFLVLWYAFDENGRWLYRSGLKRGAKGTGKDPFGAAMCDIELVGRSQLIWSKAENTFVGVRHLLPLVQIAGNSEAQAKDMLRIANALFGRDARDFYGIDCGETRTILKDGGRLELLTASEKSSEGDAATFIALNESHHMTEASGGHRIAEVARRNVGKSPAALQARLCEFTNAHRMGSDSVAERTFNAWQSQVQKRGNLRQDILYDSIEADPATRLHVPAELEAAIEAAYSDSPWADLERIRDEVLDPRTSPGDSIRYYLNGLAAAEDAWVDPRKFDALADAQMTLQDDDQIAMFLDCSKSEDATGLVACRLSDGAVFVLGVWQKPHGDRGTGWLAPREEVDGVVRNSFDRFRVEWFGVDPSPATDDQDESLYWRAMTDAWHRDFRNKLKVWASPGVQGNSVLFDMRMSQRGGVLRNQLFTEVAMLTAREIDEDATFHHDGHSALRVHTHNAKRRPNQWGYTLGKASRDSHQLVDLAVCMVGARLGRGVALNSGKIRTGDRSQRGALVL